MAQTLIDRPQVQSGTCAQCYHFLEGICKLKAQADWEEKAEVSPDRPACHFAELLPF